MQFGSERVGRREGLIVDIRTDDGGVGYGEIAPLPGFSKESIEHAHATAVRCIDGLTRRQNVDPRIPTALRDRETIPPSVRFGIECALWDLAARATKASPASLLVENAATRVPVSALLLGDRERVLADASALKSSGIAAVKLKVARGAAESEVDTIRRLRELLGIGVAIRLDANRGWGFDEALAFARQAAECNIAYIEEPIADPQRLAEFAERSPIPFAVDETLQDIGWDQLHAWRRADLLEPFAEFPDDADPRLRAIVAGRVWVVKPTLVGISRTYLAGLLAKQCRIDPDLVVSSSFESGLGLIALANLAACAGEDALPAGLDTASWLAGDILDAPLPLVGGAIDLAEANATAARFSPDALEEITHD